MWERPRLISPVPQRRPPRAPSGGGTPEIACLETGGKVCLNASGWLLLGSLCVFSSTFPSPVNTIISLPQKGYDDFPLEKSKELHDKLFSQPADKTTYFPYISFSLILAPTVREASQEGSHRPIAKSISGAGRRGGSVPTPPLLTACGLAAEELGDPAFLRGFRPRRFDAS